MKRIFALVMVCLFIIPMFSVLLPKTHAVSESGSDAVSLFPNSTYPLLGACAAGIGESDDAVNALEDVQDNRKICGFSTLAGNNPYIDTGHTSTGNNQYDFGSTIDLYVDVDCVPGPDTVDVFTYLMTPNNDIADSRSFMGWTVQGTADDLHWFYLDLGYVYMQYVGVQWHIEINVRDSSTYVLYDSKKVFFTIGPIIKDHFTCKDHSNPYGTRTTTFYDTDDRACEYTTWDTHNCLITWCVKMKYYGPMGLYWTSDWVDLATGYSDYWAATWIFIRNYPPATSPGSWYVDVYIEESFRYRDGFDIIQTVFPSLDVTLVNPSNGATVSSPVELRARVTSGGSAIQNALARFYVDSNQVGTSYSDSSGYAYMSYSPVAGGHNWYVIAEKSGYTTGTSPIWSFTYGGPPDFAISAVPSSITIQAGSSGTTTVNIDSLNSFSSPVTLGFSNQPLGVTPSFNPPSATPPANGRATSTLTLTVDASVTPGFYQPKISGTCTAPSLYHEYMIALTITAMPTLQVSITHDLSRDYFMPEKATFTIEIRDSSGNLVTPNTIYGSFDGSDVTGKLTNIGMGRYSYRTDPLYCDLNAQSKMTHTLFVRAQKSGFSEGTASDTIQVHRYDIRLVFSGSGVLYDSEKYYPVDGLRFDGDSNIANNKANYIVSQTPTTKDSDSLADAASYVTVKTDGSYYVIEYWIYYAYDNKYLIPNIGSVPSPLRHEHDFEYLFIWVSQSSYSIKRVSLNQHLWTNNYEYTTTSAPQPMYIAVERGGHGMVIVDRKIDGTFEVVKPANSPNVAPLIDGKFSESAGSFQASLYPWKYYDCVNPTDDGFGESSLLMKSHVTTGETFINPGDAMSIHLDYSVLDPLLRLDNIYQDLTRSVGNAILLDSGSPFTPTIVPVKLGLVWIYVKFYLESPWTRDVFNNASLQLQKIGYERYMDKTIVSLLIAAASAGVGYLLKTVATSVISTGAKLFIGIAFDPINGTVTDSQGRAVGYKAGELVSEIPGSFVYYTDPSVDIYMIIMPTDDYTYSAQSKGTASYNLTAIHNSYNATSFFNATNIPVLENSVHNFKVRWEAENGNIRVNATIDQNGDGSFEYQFMSDSMLTGDEFEQTIAHDVSADTVLTSKTVIREGFTLLINVTVINQGCYAESFNITIFADKNLAVIGDEIIIGTQIVYSLINGTSAIITFTWNTAGLTLGNYTISANAEPVPGEIDTTDNTLADGWVLVTIPGDVNGDFKCEGKDIAIIAKAYGSLIGQPAYVPNADINDDGKIDGKDIAVASKYYGTRYP